MNRIVDLSNKTILIADASSLIGRDTAMLCRQLGARIVYLQDQQSGGIQMVPADEKLQYYEVCLEDTGHLESFIKQLIAETGPIDGFVYISKDNDKNESDNPDSADLRAVMDSSFYAFVEMTRCISKRDCYNPGFSIVCVCETSPTDYRKIILHDIAKASMEAAVRCFAKELSPNARANMISLVSGSTDTTTKDNPANMIAFLLSDASRLITGTNTETTSET